MRAAVVATAALVLATAACSGAGPGAGSSAPLVAPSAGTAAPAEQPTTPVPSGSASAPATGDGPVAVAGRTVEGREGATTWSLTLPEVAGPLGAEVERRVRRSADEGVSRFAAGAPEDVDSSVEVTTEVTRDDGRTVQVRLDFSFFAQGAPHPLNEVSTVVLQRADAAPVLLTDVLSDPAPALQAALRHARVAAQEDGREDPAGTLSTDVDDWADWQAGPDGLTFHFDDYQAGSYAAGLREVQVPWSVVRRWVRDDAYRLLGPA